MLLILKIYSARRLGPQDNDVHLHLKIVFIVITAILITPGKVIARDPCVSFACRKLTEWTKLSFD